MEHGAHPPPCGEGRNRRGEAEAVSGWRSGFAAPAPRVVVARVGNALRLAAVDEAAEALGLSPGMALADARAMVPDVDVAEADPAADLALVEAVADWCDRYTPLVALDLPHDDEPGPRGLYLDVAGSAHLYGGEQKLRADLLARLVAQGLAAQAAVASTAGAAWALARYGPPDVQAAWVAPGAEAAVLADLPVAALRLGADERALLDRLGLKRIGQLVGQPRAPLAARFGPKLVRRLDQALGVEDEPLSPRLPPPLLVAERRFAEPVGAADAIHATIRSLADALAPALEARSAGARFLELRLYRTTGGVARAGVGTARPVRDPGTIARLFAERLAALGETFGTAQDVFGSGGFGFDMVRLAVKETEALDAAQIDLAGGGHAAAGFDALVDRLGARLGLHRVTRPEPVESHVPERAVVMRPLAEAPPQSRSPLRGSAARPFDKPGARGLAPQGEDGEWAGTSRSLILRHGVVDGDRASKGEGSRQEGSYDIEVPPARPLRLFSRPEPVEVIAAVPDGPPIAFRWRRVLYRVRAAEGPERIAPEWWRDQESATRDYYRLEDAEGRRYWLFRDGLYEEAAGAPAWYVHGLFA